MGSEAVRVCNALEKRENPLPEDEIHFIGMCYQIMKLMKSRMENLSAQLLYGKAKERLRGKQVLSRTCWGHWEARQKHAEEIHQHLSKNHA